VSDWRRTDRRASTDAESWSLAPSLQHVALVLSVLVGRGGQVVVRFPGAASNRGPRVSLRRYPLEALAVPVRQPSSLWSPGCPFPDHPCAGGRTTARLPARRPAVEDPGEHLPLRQLTWVDRPSAAGLPSSASPPYARWQSCRSRLMGCLATLVVVLGLRTTVAKTGKKKRSRVTGQRGLAQRRWRPALCVSPRMGGLEVNGEAARRHPSWSPAWATALCGLSASGADDPRAAAGMRDSPARTTIRCRPPPPIVRGCRKHGRTIGRLRRRRPPGAAGARADVAGGGCCIVALVRSAVGRSRSRWPSPPPGPCCSGPRWPVSTTRMSPVSGSWRGG
jgi:hypothetical protein